MKAVCSLNEAIGKWHSHGFLEGDEKHPVSREMTSVHLKALHFPFHTAILIQKIYFGNTFLIL